MREFFPGCGLDVQPVPNANQVSLGLRTSDATTYHRPQDVGFGLTHVLPILTAALAANSANVLLIENPEAHLHPAGQSLMGQFLARVASAGVQVLLETHSDHVLNGVRRAVRDSMLAPHDVAIHFFQERDRAAANGSSQVVSPQIDSQGNIDHWPEGFFDQLDKDMSYFAGWDG
jgi:predicted ATPase